MDEGQLDPKKVYDHAAHILKQLARLTQAVIAEIERDGLYDAHPALRLEMGNAIALIMRLRKE